jgi:hypothetical protein
LLSTVLNLTVGGRFTDVSCGFRAFTRDAALRIDIHSDFEYIHESLLIWSRCGQVIKEVSLPVRAERAIGESRIAASIVSYAARSAPVLIRAIRDYSPLKFFGFLSIAAFVPAMLFAGIVTVHWLITGETAPYTQMITLSVGGTLLAILLGVLALIADLIARLKFQVEELVYESRRNRAAESTNGPAQEQWPDDRDDRGDFAAGSRDANRAVASI